MIKAYLHTEDAILSLTVELENLDSIDTSSLVWLDMISPTPDESIAVERAMKLELPARQESEEIEYS